MISAAKAGNGGAEKGMTLSRSKLELFLECPRCFFRDKKLGIPRPDGYAYSLNLAVDALLKKEFDSYRVMGERHPLMKQWGVTAVPLYHPSLNDWREAMRGLRTVDEKSGLTLHGAVDDVWEEKSGELSVVDYKCTGRASANPGSQPLRDSYKRQVEVYQWILRKMGFRVSSTAYFVFAAADREKESLAGALNFQMSIVRYDVDDSWVPDALLEARTCLEREQAPQASEDCQWCLYIQKSRGNPESLIFP